MRAGPLEADEFVQAFADHGRTLWLLAAAWVGREDATDLVQETARIAWERRAQFSSGDARSWLSQIARHVGSNWRRCRRPALLDALPGNAPAEPVAPSTVPPHWPLRPDVHLSDHLARALAGLPETARACLLLHVVAEHTFTEIAAMLDLPANTVGSHVHRARAALREALPSTADRTPAKEPR